MFPCSAEPAELRNKSWLTAQNDLQTIHSQEDAFMTHQECYNDQECYNNSQRKSSDVDKQELQWVQ